MPALGQLLERLRRLRPAPGAAAGVVAVPAAGDQLSGEVSFLFDELDQIQQRRELILEAARAEAAEIEAVAERQSERLLEQAEAEGERVVSDLLARRRARSERRAGDLLRTAELTATRVLNRGRARTPEMAELVIARVLEDGG